MLTRLARWGVWTMTVLAWTGTRCAAESAAVSLDLVRDGKPAKLLRDDGTYQNGGYWATPLPWLMVTVMQEDPARSARLFCEAVEDFQARKDINEWVNDHAVKRRGVRDYCASAAMPLAGVRHLRAHLAKSGKQLPKDLARRLDADEAWLKTQATRVLRGSSRLGKGGVRIFTPDATGGYGAFWVRDWSYAIEGCRETFSQAEFRAGYLFLAAAQRADGCMPDRVAADGQGVYSPGGEKNPFSAHGSVDQSPFMVILCHQYWKLHHDLQPFQQTAAALEKALRFTPRDPTSGLVRITDAKLFRPYSFLDTVPLVGDQQFDSILFWDACRKLAELFEAAGEPARAAPWRREAERVKASLGSLWDEELGLFVAASERWRQPSIWGSLFAVYVGLAAPEQARRITRYCLDHEDLFVFRGQVRHLPKGTFWGQPEPQWVDAPPAKASASRFFNAVKTFADNALTCGRDRFGAKQTPLFVDGVDVNTRQPVLWLCEPVEKAEAWALSNLSCQQNLFRVLEGVSELSGDPRYQAAAEEATRYVFEHLCGANGLPYWGGHTAYDALGDTIAPKPVPHVSHQVHELKSCFPHYPLMWRVDAGKTQQLLRALWLSHVWNWTTLDFNRHGRFDRREGEPWKDTRELKPVWFESPSLTFINAGSDLFYAWAFLHQQTGEEWPLMWAKRLARRYVEARDPQTGLGGGQFNRFPAGFKDRAREQFGLEFGDDVWDGMTLIVGKGDPERRYAVVAACELLLSETLGQKGAEFRQWAVEDLKAYARHAYNPTSNTLTSLLTDGRKLTPDTVKRDGYYGPPENFKPLPVRAPFFRAYALGWRLSGDAALWRTLREMGRGFGLGELGAAPGVETTPNLQTSCDEPEIVLGLLELHQRTRQADYLRLAAAVGDNILARRFQQGFFVVEPRQPHAKFDSPEPVALLHLHAAMIGKRARLPTAWPSGSYFHHNFRGKGNGFDNDFLYGRLTDGQISFSRQPKQKPAASPGPRSASRGSDSAPALQAAGGAFAAFREGARPLPEKKDVIGAAP